MNGYAGKILKVNLSQNPKVTVDPLNENFAKKFIGGKGFGAKLLYDLLPAKTDPLSPSNPLIYCTGPITGTLVPCNRFCIVTKSPLNNTFNDTYAGGDFGQELKFAGYDVAIISGKAEKPVYLQIYDDDVQIKNADHLWGLDTYEIYKVLKSDLNDETIKLSCIGPAGENLVKYALVDCDSHRQAGRGGAGAVMGSKNLKAIAVRGTKGISVADRGSLEKEVQKISQDMAISEKKSAHWLQRGGTPAFIKFANEEAFFPYRNFQDQTSEIAEKMDDFHQRKSFWLREFGCFACPLHCSKVGMIKAGPYAGTICDVVEYENVGMLGTDCDIGDVEAIAYAQHLCDKLGLDAISTGNIVGFLMECYENGIVDKKDVGGLDLNFGNWKAQIDLINMIAYRKGIGDILAEGVMKAAKSINKGAEKLAVHIKGLESPAWAPRGSPGEGLALATSDRGGCHQRAWPIGFEVFGTTWPGGFPIERLSTEGKADAVIWDQHHLAALYSLVICEIFSHGGVMNESYAPLVSAVTGWELTYPKLLEYGERIWNAVRMFNWREGYERKDDTLPPRFKEPLPSGPAKGHKFSDEDIDKMLDDYYTKRGWDERGKPTKEKLTELGLDSMITNG
jgi:aldehyde:ferredoxin oxidoreductase